MPYVTRFHLFNGLNLDGSWFWSWANIKHFQLKPYCCHNSSCKLECEPCVWRLVRVIDALSHWCQHGLVVAPQVVIDATKPHLQCLRPLTEWVCALKHLVHSWQDPCTHKARSWSHHPIQDAKDPADGVEDPGDGVEAPMDDGEALDGLEKH